MIKKLAFGTLLTLTSCFTDAQEEIDSQASVKNLSVSYQDFKLDSISSPANAFNILSDPSADTTSKAYKDAFNRKLYSLHLSLSLETSNSKSSTAKSQGLEVSTIMNELKDQSIDLAFQPFEVAGNETTTQTAETAVNFDQQNQTVKYILTNSIAETPLKSEFGINILYDVELSEGKITLPSLEQDLETKGKIPASLRDQMEIIINSGLLD